MKRYTQPKAGTNEKDVRKDIDNNARPNYDRQAGILVFLQNMYKGEIKREWQ